MRFNDLTRIQDEIEEEIDPDVAFYSDMRRHRMTLEHVNRLRKLRELTKYEQKTRLEAISKMYARPPAV